MQQNKILIEIKPVGPGKVRFWPKNGDKILEWCMINCKGKFHTNWYRFPISTGDYFFEKLWVHFENKEDMALFIIFHSEYKILHV
jgi:hypothetical protein